MTDILLVARRELLAQARTKGYLIGLIVSALVVAAIVAIPQLISSDETYDLALVGTESESLEPAIHQVAAQSDVEIETDRYADEEAARGAITDDGLDAAVVDASVILSDGDLDSTLDAVVQGAYAAVTSQAQLMDAGLSPSEIQDALDVEPLDSELIGGEDNGAREAVAFLVVLALFFLIIGSASMVAIGVVEEKSSRIVEILLIAVRPWQLLAGKIVAFIILGLVQLVVFTAAGLSAAAAVGSLGEIPSGMVGIVAAALVGFLLGFLFYAAAAAAFASLVSRQEEVNQVLGPMMLTIMASYLVAIWALNSPGATASEVLSMVPPFSALVMPVRVATIGVPGWQVAVAVVAMLVAVGGMLYFGGSIYERAVLRTGSRLKLTEVLKARQHDSDVVAQ